MQEKVKGFFQKIKQWWLSAAKKTKILLGTGAAAVLVVIALVLVVSLNQPYTVLFTGLNQTDLTAIVSYLSDNGVTDYQIQGEDTVLVPESQEEQLKAALLIEGYPNSGSGYSMYLDHVSSLTTESERSQLALYDLQDRLAGVIRNFSSVRDAAVFITPGEDHTYVLDSGNVVEARATVIVTMEEGASLTDGQVKAIRNAVSHAVQGLSIDAVAIEDQFGNNYTAQDGITDVQDISALKMRLEEQTNNKIRTQVMQVLIPLFGEENIRVSVNSIVNMDRTYTDSTNYSGEEDGEGIIGDRVFEQEIIRGGDETAGGTVGTPSNADLNTYVQEQLNANGDEVLISNSGEEHSLVDTEKVQVEHLAGTVADVMVSVTINQSAAGGASANSLYPHVARAAGIGTELQNEKISILIQPFYQEGTAPIPVPDGVPAWMLYAALAGLGVFVILLMVVLLIRRRSKRRKKLDGVQTVQRAEEIPAPAPEGADIMDMKTEKSLELRRDVRKFAEENPEIAAQMVKNWLREGDDAG